MRPERRIATLEGRTVQTARRSTIVAVLIAIHHIWATSILRILAGAVHAIAPSLTLNVLAKIRRRRIPSSRALSRRWRRRRSVPISVLRHGDRRHSQSCCEHGRYDTSLDVHAKFLSCPSRSEQRSEFGATTYEKTPFGTAGCGCVLPHLTDFAQASASPHKAGIVGRLLGGRDRIAIFRPTLH